jgi:hypothetical protein
VDNIEHRGAVSVNKLGVDATFKRNGNIMLVTLFMCIIVNLKHPTPFERVYTARINIDPHGWNILERALTCQIA